MKCAVAFYINSIENNMKNDYVTKNDTTATTATKKRCLVFKHARKMKKMSLASTIGDIKWQLDRQNHVGSTSNMIHI